ASACSCVCLTVYVCVCVCVCVECSTSRQVNGYVGQNVTLQCSYKSQSEVEACWNRDWFSGLSCRNSQLISSDGHKVIEATRASSRYQLLGPLDKGDVSLTILNLTEADAGTYGCRVEIPGWFNDEKHYITLVVKKAEQTTTSATSTSQTVTATTAFSTAAGTAPVSMRSAFGPETPDHRL
uniref:Ig-like domain-containing protein n=1 Tax=Takifugu rubripes TaxID=31033 RepID=H2RZE9_TAKRU